MKRKVIKCNDCGEKDAEFKITYIKKSRIIFGKHDFFCYECLINNLEGLHSGGGPTCDAFQLIKRIKKSEGLYS